jgi:metal-sulfur cluster biosynthetic enzyme
VTRQSDEAIAARITDALRVVIDPELGFNIVDLGLVYCIAVGNGVARVLMTTTTRGCPATAYLKDGVREAAAAVPGIDAVEITVTYDPPWTPAMMTAAAKAHLGMS